MGTKHSWSEKSRNRYATLLSKAGKDKVRLDAFIADLAPHLQDVLGRILTGAPFHKIAADLGTTAPTIMKVFHDLCGFLERKLTSTNVREYATRLLDWNCAKDELEADFGLINRFFNEDIIQRRPIDLFTGVSKAIRDDIPDATLFLSRYAAAYRFLDGGAPRPLSWVKGKNFADHFTDAKHVRDTFLDGLNRGSAHSKPVQALLGGYYEFLVAKIDTKKIAFFIRQIG